MLSQLITDLKSQVANRRSEIEQLEEKIAEFEALATTLQVDNLDRK